MSERYAVFRYKIGAFVSNGHGVLAWTPDRTEADETAQVMVGAVVDADDFSVNWPLYVLVAALAGEMPVDLAAQRIPPEWLAGVRNKDAQRRDGR